MCSTRRDASVECTVCAWQGKEWLTDSHCCPHCGGECMVQEEALYSREEPDADPDW